MLDLCDSVYPYDFIIFLALPSALSYSTKPVTNNWATLTCIILIKQIDISFQFLVAYHFNLLWWVWLVSLVAIVCDFGLIAAVIFVTAIVSIFGCMIMLILLDSNGIIFILGSRIISASFLELFEFIILWMACGGLSLGLIFAVLANS